MAQMKVVVRVPTMTDDKSKQKAFEAVADIYGIDSIAADVKDNRMTIVGEMDTVAVAKKLKKLLGKVDIVSVGPAKKPDEQPKKPPPPAAAPAAAAAADKKPPPPAAAAQPEKMTTPDAATNKDKKL